MMNIKKALDTLQIDGDTLNRFDSETKLQNRINKQFKKLALQLRV